MARFCKFIITFGISLVATALMLKIYSFCSFSNGYTVNLLDTLACTFIVYIGIGVVRICTLVDFLNTAYKYPQYISIFKSCWAMDGLYRLNDKEKELYDLLESVKQQENKAEEVGKKLDQLEKDFGVKKEDDEDGNNVP